MAGPRRHGTSKLVSIGRDVGGCHWLAVAGGASESSALFDI